MNVVLLGDMGGIDGLLASPSAAATEPPAAALFDTRCSDDASDTLVLVPGTTLPAACETPSTGVTDEPLLSPSAVQLRMWRPTFVKGVAVPQMPVATAAECRAEAASAFMDAAIDAAVALVAQAKQACEAVPPGSTKKAMKQARRAVAAAEVELINVRGKRSALLRAV